MQLLLQSILFKLCVLLKSHNWLISYKAGGIRSQFNHTMKLCSQGLVQVGYQPQEEKSIVE